MSQTFQQENLKQEQEDNQREENVVDNPLLGPVEVISANGDITYGKKLFVDTDGKLTFLDKTSSKYVILILVMCCLVFLPLGMMCVFIVVITVVSIWGLFFTQEEAMLSMLIFPCGLTLPVMIGAITILLTMSWAIYALHRRFVVKFDDMNRKIIVEKLLYYYFGSLELKKTEVDYTNIRDFEVQLFSSKLQSNRVNKFARVNIITKDTENNKVPMSLYKQTEMVKSLCRELKDTMLEKLDVGSQTQTMY